LCRDWCQIGVKPCDEMNVKTGTKIGVKIGAKPCDEMGVRIGANTSD